MIIAGIGSRKTPPRILQIMEEFARDAATKGIWFRSGHADGADYAFEKGAEQQCIVYLPWDGFNHKLPLLGRGVSMNIVDKKAFKLVLEHEPYAADCSNGVQLLKCRNVYQILGKDLNTPCHLVVCWTDGGGDIGGTGLAIKIAKKLKIPVLNLGALSREFDKQIVWEFIEKYGVVT